MVFETVEKPPGFSDKRIAACGRQTLRGFFDTLKYHRRNAMVFFYAAAMYPAHRRNWPEK